jgi:hypothetical protein
MPKKELAEANAVDAERLLKLFEETEAEANELEDRIGREQAQVWAIAQLKALNESQLLAVRWCLFDQRRELVSDGVALKSALQGLKHQMEELVRYETKRHSSIRDAISDSDRVQDADRYFKIARQVIALGLKGSDAKAEYDNECKRRGLAVHSDTQRRHYLRKARRFE